jgi:hypothetical protein
MLDLAPRFDARRNNFSRWSTAGGPQPERWDRNQRQSTTPASPIVALFAIDRAYMDGQNADQVMSLLRWVGVHVTNGQTICCRHSEKWPGDSPSGKKRRARDR